MKFSMRELLTKLVRSENSMYTFVITLILLILVCLWFLVQPPLLISILITVILLWSLYYQLAAVYFDVSGPMMHMKIEDRIMSELYYQVSKRGYEIYFTYRDEKLIIKKHNIPKWTAKWIKLVSFFHVVSRPAWAYRDVDETEVLVDDENDVILVPTPYTP